MKKLKAMTMVEILVAIAIIAVLTSLAAFGISALQRNSRDAQRVTTLSQMATALNDYKKKYLNYPVTNLVTFNTTFNINSVPQFNLNNSNVYGASTSPSETRYEYVNNNGKFGLCAVLESGRIENVGEINIDCQ